MSCLDRYMWEGNPIRLLSLDAAKRALEYMLSKEAALRVTDRFVIITELKANIKKMETAMIQQPIEAAPMPECVVRSYPTYYWKCSKCNMANHHTWLGGIPDVVRCGGCMAEYKTVKA